MHPGWIGAIVGGGLGVVGGLVGTYFSIRNTNGPRERAFMIKCSLVGWTLIILFLVLMIVLPNPYRFFLWIPYSILLPLGIRYGNRTQQRIRKQEADGRNDASSEP